MRELPTGIIYGNNKSLLHLLLRFIYRAVAITGFFSSKFGMDSYAFIYGRFKNITEGKVRNKVLEFIRPGTIVIDVGANIGTFTRSLLSKVGTNGMVVAVEPESRNIKNLQQSFSKELESGQLKLFDCAVTDKQGDCYLHIDPCNPGGHTLASRGIPIKGITIDQIVSDVGLIPTFIKIDVEGYEPKIIFGAKGTINKFHPVIFTEFNPLLMSECGSNAHKFLQDLTDYGYSFFIFVRGPKIQEVSHEQIIDKSNEHGWVDLLMLYKHSNLYINTTRKT
tara:strand:- start:87 stop:923 length:837 start_codon:yes stop_codon:yes gene_type:complete